MIKLRPYRLVMLATVLVVMFFALAFKPEHKQADTKKDLVVKNFITEKSISMVAMLQEMEEVIASKTWNHRLPELREKLLYVRNYYKEIEPFIMYYFPLDAFAVNMMDLTYPEEEDEIAILLEPHGLQVMDRILFGDSSEVQRKIIRYEIEGVLDVVRRWPKSVRDTVFLESDVFEAIQLGMIKSHLFGLTNIETPGSGNAFRETVRFIEAMQQLLSEMYLEDSLWTGYLQAELFSKFDLLKEMIIQEEGKEHPDYFTIYSAYYIPASDVLQKVRHFMVKDNFYQTGAVNLEVRSIFDPGAFNSYFFISGKKINNREEVAELGRVLFFDPALSLNSQRACASCHDPKKAFTDGLPVSLAFHAGSTLNRNAPGIINSVLQRRLFLDGRAFSFENQATEVLNNPDEMHSDFANVSDLLKQSNEYREMFKSAFLDSPDTQITSRSILIAIAEYERNLIALNSRFDKAIRGDHDIMSEDEKKGFNLFMGKANCASCHFVPLFNGTVPPLFIATEMEAIGVPGNADLDHPLKDKDPGRESIIPMEFHSGKFKTTTVRNVELTAPYMHNGVFQTLEEVVEFYNRGGGQGIGLDIPNQTLAPDSLGLTAEEKAQLVMFMKSLTDTVNTTSAPVRLPGFGNNHVLNSRVIGGEY